MKRLLIFIAIALLVGYGLFEARRLLEGPEVTIEWPKDGSATSTTALVVSGTAKNISFLTINDGPVYTTEEGQFVETLSPPPGYTVVRVAAVDRFGRRAQKEVTITVLNYCTEHYG